MGTQLPSAKGAHPPPNFQLTAGWMTTPLGTEVDLGPGHIVLDRVPALRETGTAAPPHLIGPCLLWPRSPISATAEVFFKLPMSTMGWVGLGQVKTFTSWVWLGAKILGLVAFQISDLYDLITAY